LKILIALGGNAILKSKENGTEKEQLFNVQATTDELANLVAQGHRISITHGNGPQVGMIVRLYELAKRTVPRMPLDVCGAQSQGMIGYLLQQCMDNSLKRRRLNIPTIALLTQTLVDKNDLAFGRPSKPIGSFYNKRKAEEMKAENGWRIKQDSNRGYRRVVASPDPKAVVERKTIKKLFELGYIVIHSGGGGIPVIRARNGALKGIEAVIDKDLTASLIASLLHVDVFLILTDVKKVYLNYGSSNQTPLDKLTLRECAKYQKEGQFATGSMGPKIEAARRFVSSSKKKATITSLESALQALDGKTGTTITYD
jgi:carbamate kinase